MGSILTNMLLRDLNDLLIQHERQITNYDLPTISLEDNENNSLRMVIQEELLVQVPNKDVECVQKLNNDKLIFLMPLWMLSIINKIKFSL